MEKIYKKLEIVANVLIIIVTIAIAVVIVKGYLFSSNHAGQAQNFKNMLGTTLVVPNINWKENDKNLLIVLKQGCPFCAESAGFYQKLISETNKNNVRVIAVLPQDIKESKKYLNELNIPIQEIRQSSLESINVSGVPTLALIDKNGVVTNTWIGKLTPEEELNVIKTLE